jgi:hypothetical protein
MVLGMRIPCGRPARSSRPAAGLSAVDNDIKTQGERLVNDIFTKKMTCNGRKDWESADCADFR